MCEESTASLTGSAPPQRAKGDVPVKRNVLFLPPAPRRGARPRTRPGMSAFLLCLLGVFAAPTQAQTSGGRTLSGTVKLEGPVNSAVPLTFDFCAVDRAFFLEKTVTPAANGAFSVADLPPGQYNVYVKGGKWLREPLSISGSATLDLRAGDQSGAIVQSVNDWLPAGDSNNDNSVDSTDFTALIGSFNSDASVPGGGYDVTADFNNDGFVDSSDFTLLIGQFNNVGQEYATNLRTAPAAGGGVLLTWTASLGATQVHIYRAAAGGSFALIATTAAGASYPDASGTGALLYKIVALDQHGVEGLPSNVAGGVPLPVSLASVDTAQPGWAEDIIPTDSPATAGAGPSSATAIDVSSGILENHPGPDLDAHNPVGLSPTFARLYRSAQSERNYHSPGMARGWSHNLDLRITQTGAALKLTYPNGAVETWTANGTKITPQTLGTPYVVTGLGTAGAFTKLTMQFKDRTSYVFTLPLADGVLRLTQMVNAVGSAVNIAYKTDGTLNTLANDANPAQTLLTFAYSGNLMQSVTDNVGGRVITYTYDTGGNLATVSQVNSATALWAYKYVSITNTSNGNNVWPLLSQVGVPDPTQPTLNQIAYYPATQADGVGRVTGFSDANRNQRVYKYGNGSTTVEAREPDGTLDTTWTQNFDATGADTGTTDAYGYSNSIVYGNAVGNPKRPIQFLNRNGQLTQVAYDSYGNVTKISTPFSHNNGTQQLATKFTYNYTLFPFGQVASVQDGNDSLNAYRTPTTYTYYDGTTSTTAGIVQSKGLLHTVMEPTPGTVNGPAIQTTEYFYTTRGNIAQINTLAPNQTAGGTSVISVVYEYQNDGAFTPEPLATPEALGQPVRITSPRNNTTATSAIHLRYDALGNVTRIYDEFGNQTAFKYNDARQVTMVMFPPTAAGGGRASVTYIYPRLGGPALTSNYYDEAGTLQKSVSRAAGNEDEFKYASGNVVQYSSNYDSLYRQKKLTNGNMVVAQQYGYDLVGNATSVTYADGTGDKYTKFDPDGNLMQRMDANGKATNYALAAADSHLDAITYPADAAQNIAYTYDDYGRIASATDKTGVRTYQYDDLDNLTLATTQYYAPNGALLPQVQTTYQYYTDGSEYLMLFGWQDTLGTGQQTFQTKYVYNLDGSEQRVEFPWQNFQINGGRNNSGNVNFTYDARGRVTRTRQTLISTDHAYNSRDFVTGLRNYNAGAVVNLSLFGSTTSAAFGVQYDALGNPLTVPYTVKITNDTDSSGVITYSYDDQLRLKEEKRTLAAVMQTGNVFYDNPFIKDPAGNLTNVRGATFGDKPADQISNGGFVFDLNGNLKQTVSVDENNNLTNYSLNYDLEDQPTSYGPVTMAFRADGQRAWKSIRGGARTYFLYDGDQLIAEMDGSNRLTAYYGNCSVGRLQRYEQQYPSTTSGTPVLSGRTFRAYTYDIWGNLAHRVNDDDLATRSLYAADTAIYDRLGGFYTDWGFLLGGAPAQFPYLDPIGALGQWGEYTDLELRPTVMATPPILASNGYLDPQVGRLQSRQKGLQNEYEFQQFFYDFLAGTAKGVLNTVWQQGVGTVLGLQGSLALNGVAEGNPRVADALDKLYNPYQYSSHNQAIFGAFAAGATEVVGAYDAGAGAIGGAGEALKSPYFPPESVGEYGSTGGHHIHAKAAFKGDPNYNPNSALTVSQAEMARRGWSHEAMTARQAQSFDEMLAGQRASTMREHSKIAVDALMAGGASRQEARALTAKSLRNLRRQGVRRPTRIPTFPPFVRRG